MTIVLLTHREDLEAREFLDKKSAQYQRISVKRANGELVNADVIINKCGVSPRFHFKDLGDSEKLEDLRAWMELCGEDVRRPVTYVIGTENRLGDKVRLYARRREGMEIVIPAGDGLMDVVAFLEDRKPALISLPLASINLTQLVVRHFLPDEMDWSSISVIAFGTCGGWGMDSERARGFFP